MKKLRYIIACGAVITGLLVVSCKNYLSAPPQGSLASTVLQNQKGVNALLIGAYGALDGSGNGNGNDLTGTYAPWEASPDNWIYADVAGGDVHKGSTSGDQGSGINPIATMTVTPQNGFLDAKWRVDYEGIARCNQVIITANQAKDLSSSQKNEMIGEARFLRGYWYSDLKKMFNNVPWIDENTKDFHQPNHDNSGNYINIWPKIEADFTFAMKNLPGTQSDFGRANKWAAEAFLAKAYMFEHKYSDAEKLYDDIIANGTNSAGVKYALVPNFEDNFKTGAQNNSEVIFAVQQTANDGTASISNARIGDMLNFPYNSPFGCCGFYQPSLDLVNSYRTDGNGLPYVSAAQPFAYDDTMVTNDMGVSPHDSTYTMYQGHLDPRLGWTAGRRGVPYLDWGPFPGVRWVRDPSNGGPYAGKKQIYWKALESTEADHNSWAPGTAINYDAMRYAGLLLMAAEAKAQDGKLEAARALVNQVRDRMINNPQNWVNYTLNEAYAVKTVDSQSAMLALSGVNEFDWVVRSDTKSTWVLVGRGTEAEQKAGTVSQDIKNWIEYKDPNYKIGDYTQPWTNKQDALTKIWFERKLELAGEGHRFFDLVREGTVKQQLDNFYSYDGKYISDVAGATFQSFHDYYPIPQNQIDIMGKGTDGKNILKQNPGYN